LEGLSDRIGKTVNRFPTFRVLFKLAENLPSGEMWQSHHQDLLISSFKLGE
jgi:hypothetical protein